MPGEVTRLGFRLDPRFFELFSIGDAQGLVGAEFPVTWGEHEARGKVTGVDAGPDADERGVLVTMEVSAATEADFPAFLAY